MLEGEALPLLAERLMEKYEHEPEHVRHVEKLSMQLFDGLREAFGFDGGMRTKLRFAALAHDIGHYVDSAEHHAHSAYLILVDETTRSLDVELRDELAWLALNHRKRKLIDADRFRKNKRLELGRLATLLRLADALDYEHEQRANVVGVACDRSDGRILVTAEGVDVESLRRKLEKKLAPAARFGFGLLGVTDGRSTVFAAGDDR